MTDYSVLNLEQVVYIHEHIVAFSGGLQGARDVGLLHSALERPKATFGGDDLYLSIVEKAAALIHSLVNNHPFVDGNKRTAYAVLVRFLAANDFVLDVSQEDVVLFCVGVAEGMEVLEIGEWIGDRIEE